MTSKEKSPTTGLGVVLSYEKSDIVVTALHPDGPGSNSGVVVGDVIIGVNNVDVRGLGTDQVGALCRESPKNQCLLTIKRDGKEEKITVQKGEIPKEAPSPNTVRVSSSEAWASTTKSSSSASASASASAAAGAKSPSSSVRNLSASSSSVTAAAASTASSAPAPDNYRYHQQMQQLTASARQSASAHVRADDVEVVMTRAQVSLEQAVEALHSSGNDVVEAIFSLRARGIGSASVRSATSNTSTSPVASGNNGTLYSRTTVPPQLLTSSTAPSSSVPATKEKESDRGPYSPPSSSSPPRPGVPTSSQAMMLHNAAKEAAKRASAAVVAAIGLSASGGGGGGNTSASSPFSPPGQKASNSAGGRDIASYSGGGMGGSLRGNLNSGGGGGGGGGGSGGAMLSSASLRGGPASQNYFASMNGSSPYAASSQSVRSIGSATSMTDAQFLQQQRADLDNAHAWMAARQDLNSSASSVSSQSRNPLQRRLEHTAAELAEARATIAKKDYDLDIARKAIDAMRSAVDEAVNRTLSDAAREKAELQLELSRMETALKAQQKETQRYAEMAAHTQTDLNAMEREADILASSIAIADMRPSESAPVQRVMGTDEASALENYARLVERLENELSQTRQALLARDELITALAAQKNLNGAPLMSPSRSVRDRTPQKGAGNYPPPSPAMYYAL